MSSLLDTAVSATQLRNVVDGGYCVGCGVCASSPGPGNGIILRSNADGFYVADLSVAADAELEWGEAVCPFATRLREDELAAKLFQVEQAQHSVNDIVGIYQALYAGHSVSHREVGSSGGLATWLLTHLLERGVVDGVFHVGRTGERDPFFGYVLSKSVPEVTSRSTSIYYPVKLDGVIDYVRTHPGRYAVTAIPCFAKALRLVARGDPVLTERIVCVIGIVCGQLKSKLYLEYLARKAGATSPLTDACFRVKDPADRADNYLFEARYTDIEGKTARVAVKNNAIGANWGMGYFKPLACDYCDDVFAETADVAFMDAWLPKYVQDGRGTSLSVVRSSVVHREMIKAMANGELRLESVSVSEVIASQRGGLNHRRVGLRYRLHRSRNRWVPRKRVTPSNAVHWSFRLDQRLRSIMRAASSGVMRHQMRTRGIYQFDLLMKPLMLLYKLVGRIKKGYGAESGGTRGDRAYRLD